MPSECVGVEALFREEQLSLPSIEPQGARMVSIEPCPPIWSWVVILGMYGGAIVIFVVYTLYAHRREWWKALTRKM